MAFPRLFIFGLIASLVFSCQQVESPRATQESNAKATSPRPNIVLIVADDLGYGDLGSYGQQKIETPFLDQMAREGMRFTDFYAGSPVCAPSRATLLTGLHQGHAYVRDNWEAGGWEEDDPEGQLPLPMGTYTLSSALQNAGYATACIGKWRLGGPGKRGRAAKSWLRPVLWLPLSAPGAQFLPHPFMAQSRQGGARREYMEKPHRQALLS